VPRGWCGHHAAPLRHHAAQPDRWPPRGCMATRVLLGASAIRAPGGLKRTRHCVACHTGPALRPGVVTDAGFAITRSSSWSPPRGSRPPDVAGGRRGAPARCPASPPGESPPPPPSSEHWPPPRAPWPLPAGFLLRGDCRVLLTGLPCPYERWLRPAYVRRAWREVEWPHCSTARFHSAMGRGVATTLCVLLCVGTYVDAARMGGSADVKADAAKLGGKDLAPKKPAPAAPADDGACRSHARCMGPVQLWLPAGSTCPC
jgi:hypothetical protein